MADDLNFLLESDCDFLISPALVSDLTKGRYKISVTALFIKPFTILKGINTVGSIFITTLLGTFMYSGVMYTFHKTITSVRITVPSARPPIAPRNVRFLYYTKAATQQNAPVDIIFIISPIGPVLLTVTISTSATTTVISAA